MASTASLLRPRFSTTTWTSGLSTDESRSNVKRRQRDVRLSGHREVLFLTLDVFWQGRRQ